MKQTNILSWGKCRLYLFQKTRILWNIKVQKVVVIVFMGKREISYYETSWKLFVCFWKRSLNTLFKRPFRDFLSSFLSTLSGYTCARWVGALKRHLALEVVESSKRILRMNFLVLLTACVAVRETFFTWAKMKFFDNCDRRIKDF